MHNISKYYLDPVLSVIGKKGASPVQAKPVKNLTTQLHYRAKGNAVTKRTAGTIRHSGIRHHRSRSMGGY